MFINLINRVIADTGRTDKTTLIKDFINEAQRRIVLAGARKDYDFKDLKVIDSSISTVAKQETINLPANCRAILGVLLLDNSEYNPLIFKPPRHYDKIHRPNHFGKPSIYTQKQSGKLHLSKGIPNKDYKLCVYYSKWPTIMELDDDFPDLKNIDDLIVALANYRLYMSLDLPGKATSWKIVANEMLAEYIASDMQKEDWQPIAKGFSIEPAVSLEEPWKNPFIK